MGIDGNYLFASDVSSQSQFYGQTSLQNPVSRQSQHAEAAKYANQVVENLQKSKVFEQYGNNAEAMKQMAYARAYEQYIQRVQSNNFGMVATNNPYSAIINSPTAYKPLFNTRQQLMSLGNAPLFNNRQSQNAGLGQSPPTYADYQLLDSALKFYGVK